MYVAQQLLSAVMPRETAAERAEDAPVEIYPYEYVRRRRRSEVGHVDRIHDASITLQFADAPTARTLSIALLHLDREARRTAQSIQEDIPPWIMRAHRRRLRPSREGLVVKDARSGSLEVLLLFGCLQSAVTSQPISFALNLAALIGYTRTVIRAILPNGQEERRAVEVVREPPEEYTRGIVFRDSSREVFIPMELNAAKIRFKADDGSELQIELSPPKNEAKSTEQRTSNSEGGSSD